VTRKGEIEAFVERLGEFYSRLGLQRGAGRVIGWLLVCDPPHQSAPDLEAATGSSKASISIHLRLLVAAGLVERIGLPGERRAFYRIRPTAWTEDLKGKVAQLTELKEIAQSGLKALEGSSPASRSRLEVMRDFYTFMEREFPSVIDKWLQRRK
jgi:DNA-binding transcriptional regulator GbsR (MarR family)